MLLASIESYGPKVKTFKKFWSIDYTTFCYSSQLGLYVYVRCLKRRHYLSASP